MSERFRVASDVDAGKTQKLAPTNTLLIDAADEEAVYSSWEFVALPAPLMRDVEDNRIIGYLAGREVRVKGLKN